MTDGDRSMLVLEAGGSALDIEIAPNEWCRVYLRQDGARTKLGAETWDVMAPRLRLATDARSVFDADAAGGEVYVTAFFENWARIYASRDGDDVCLRIEDRDAQPLGRIRLTRADQAAWRATLEKRPQETRE